MNKQELLLHYMDTIDKMLDTLGIPGEIPKGSFYDLSTEEENMNNRKRGGQPGNQNARKHGYYSRHFTPEEMEQLEEINYHKGLDPEIALLRVKLNNMLDNPETSPELLIRAINSLARLLAIQRRYIYG